jgi:signal peptidase II
MMLGEEIPVFGKWFIIHFVENNGMAFGFEFAGDYGKYFLSIFRIVAVVGICWYLSKLWVRKVPFGFVVSVSLILAGAVGNIIDSAFYGLIYNESYGQVATLLPEGGGYAPFLKGKVVDMFYFPLIQGHYPGWFPFKGGDQFVFFRPVFNIADSAISVGIFMIILFYRRLFDTQPKEVESDQ